MNGIFSNLFGLAAPYIQDGVASLVVLGAGWLFTVLNSKLGLNIEQSRRDALTASAERVAGELVTEILAGHVSLSELFARAADGSVVPNIAHPVVAAKVAKVALAAPDALKAFGLTGNAPAIAAKVFGALGPMLAMVPGPVGMISGLAGSFLSGIAGPQPTVAVAPHAVQ